MLRVLFDLEPFLGHTGAMGLKWPASWAPQTIAMLEFYPIVLSLHLWGEAMSNQCVLLFTDNESLVHVTSKQSCKDKFLMIFVRKLVSICLHLQHHF